MTEGLFRYQIHWTAEQVFQIKLNTKITPRSRRPIEGNEDVDIAVRSQLIARCRTEQGQHGNAKDARELRFMLLQKLYHVIFVHLDFESRVLMGWIVANFLTKGTGINTEKWN